MVDISIVVPIYNASKSLNKCIDSLINQTKKEIEIILINDGSTDDSEKIIKQYKDERIKYFKNKNQGIGKTRNFGIKKSIGKYIMFVDSDDYLDKNACKIMYEKATKDKLDIVVCDYYSVLNKKVKQKVKIESFNNTSLKENPSLLLKINLAPWNKMYSKKMITKNNITFEEKLKYEDAPFVAQALDKSKTIGKIDKALNYYVIHNNSETTIRDERVFDIIKIVDKIRQYFSDKDYAKNIVNTLTIKILVNYNIQQRYQKDKKIAMKFIDESFNYMKENIPNFRKSNYFKNRNKLKAIIEKNKTLTKIYCYMYRM